MGRRYVTCNKCGWAHFEVTRQFAENEVGEFGEFYDPISTEKQQLYYGGEASSMLLYEICNVCGNSYQDFRDFKTGDCPNGCTIGPIVQRGE